MIAQKIIKSLRVIYQKLKNRKIKWVLVGSASLALQGVKIRPKDIDILTDKTGAFEINKLFKEYEVKPIKFSRSEFFKSYIGEFRINGVKVEVMANLKEKTGDRWTSFSSRLAYPRIIEIDGMKIPVSPLKEQLKSYEKIGGRKKDLAKVQKIKEALEKMPKLTKLGWDKAFKEKGRIFLKPEKSIIRVTKIFKKAGVKRILDLGCGSGRHVVYLAKQGFDVYGIDIAGYGIKIARSWLKEKGLKAHLKVGDFYKKLPYKDDFFDGIISIAALHHGKIEDIRKLIKEIKRILKPKGLIFVTLHKKLPKKKIPKDRLYGIKYIAPRTYIILGGPEKGGIHYNFNKKILKREFRDFEFLKLWLEPSHYCLLGKLKK